MLIDLAGSPFFGEARPHVIVANASVAFDLRLAAGCDADTVQVNLDRWPHQLPNETYQKRPFIRLRAQKGGCFLNCRSCVGKLKPGKNLTASEMVFQVLHVLESRFLDSSQIEQVVVGTMGIGEPFVNFAIIDAIKQLNDLIPNIRFILSTTGPKTKVTNEIFKQAVDLARQGINLDLQLSVSVPDEAWRREYVGDLEGRHILSVVEMSGLAKGWRDITGKKSHINLPVGPDFPKWLPRYYAALCRWFPPYHCKIKLSLEGPYDGAQKWDPTEYMPRLVAMEQELRLMGYQTYQFILDGLEILGASCGSSLVTIV